MLILEIFGIAIMVVILTAFITYRILKYEECDKCGEEYHKDLKKCPKCGHE